MGTAVDRTDPTSAAAAEAAACRQSGPGRVRVVVLLGGSIRSTDLTRLVGRSVLDMPLGDGKTLLQQWMHESAGLADAEGGVAPGVRVILDRQAPEPRSGQSEGVSRLVIERDPVELRGTGGLLRDLAGDYGPDDLMLVANANQVLLEPLATLASELLSLDGDVRLVAHDDGTPSGVSLVRCGALAGLGAVGFMDFKEQVLPRLAASGQTVRVLHRPVASGMPVRTAAGYVSALRRLHRGLQGLSMQEDPMADQWEGVFSVVEPGARVDVSATVLDSVVLEGASVQRGAVVVRSVVGPGGVVRSGEIVVDGVVAPRAREGRRAGG